MATQVDTLYSTTTLNIVQFLKRPTISHGMTDWTLRSAGSNKLYLVLVGYVDDERPNSLPRSLCVTVGDGGGASTWRFNCGRHSHSVGSTTR